MSKPSFRFSRRTAIKGGLAAAMSPILASKSAATQAVTPEMQRPELKVGCLSWCFHSFDSGADPEEAIDIVGSVGFDGIELIVLAPEDLKNFWTDAKIDRLRAKLTHQKLTVSRVMLFQPVVEGLTSLDPKERMRSLDTTSRPDAASSRSSAPKWWTLSLRGLGS